MSRSFLTGSRVYGTPRPDSDVDLVVLMESEEIQALALLADSNKDVSSGASRAVYDSGSCLRFGRLNLIAHWDRDVFDAWRAATEELAKAKPVTREHAIEAIKARIAKAVS